MIGSSAVFDRRRLLVVASLAALCVRCSLTVDEDSYVGGSKDAGAASDASVATDGVADSGGADARDAGSFPDGAVVWNINGHAYEVVVVPAGIDWTTAKADAIGRGGHLATLTSEAENTFVYLRTKEIEGAWAEFSPTDLRGPWIGASQQGTLEPDAGWTWVTGEPFAFTSWRSGEPDNGATIGGDPESAVHYYGGAIQAPTWNDWITAGTLNSYVVEYE